VVYLKPKQLIIKDCARRFVLKLYRHEVLRGLSATAERLVVLCEQSKSPHFLGHSVRVMDTSSITPYRPASTLH